MTISVGDRLPDVEVFTLSEAGPTPHSTAALFKGKKVVLFAVPGAFTPTCSDSHMPGFIAAAGDLKAKGVDEIYCIAVNDPFVMQAWSDKLGAGKAVTVLADGNGAFAKATGLDLDGSGFGLGLRLHRFSMLVDDGVVKSLAVEENPTVVTVSGAEGILADL